MILTRIEFTKLWLDRRKSGRLLKVRVRTEHAHPDSLFTETIEGVVRAIQIGDDDNGTTSLLLAIGGKGWAGEGRLVTGFMGSEFTALGTSKHVTVTVELLDD